MTWMAWRQFRAQFRPLGAAIVVLLAALVATRAHLVDLRAVSGAADTFLADVRQGYEGKLYLAGQVVLFALPVIIGVFWGAPLVARELETGTHRLAWNQSITRTRWLAVRLGIVALTTAAVSAACTVAYTWWASPIDAATVDRLQPFNFGAHGIVPVGYALFGLAVGTTAGMLLRRTVPAMAVTVAVLAVVQLALPFGLRQQLIPPVHTAIALDMKKLTQLGIRPDGTVSVIGEVDIRGAWVISNVTVNPDGTPFVRLADPTPCLRETASPKTCQAAIDALGLRQAVVYQPLQRFWPLQLVETGVLLAAAGLLILLSFWWLRHRVT